VIVIDKWAGLATNASPYSIPPGSTVQQTNLQCLVPGKLTARPGMQTISFASADSTASPIRSAFRYQKGTGEHLVYQDSAGRIYSSVQTGSA
jgi:hypothetical protein